MTDSSKLIGYEALLALYESMKASTPDGVGLKKVKVGEAFYIQLQFKLGDGGKRVAKACNCTFTEDGIRNAVLKAQKVAEALRKISTESEFWAWYDAEILEKNVIRNDLITFGDAIKLVEDDFWAGQTKTGMKRDRANPSHQTSWCDTYDRYYAQLPANAVNLPDIMVVINRYEQGTKAYKHCVTALRKLARMAKKQSIVDGLSELNVKQTQKRQDLQSIDIDEFLAIRDKVLGVTEELHPSANLDSRKDWMWVFSMQVVYGLRIHEVFAILNLHKSFKTPDGIVISALNDPSNKTNLIVVGNKNPKTKTTTKTGYRISAPIGHPRYPDLIERLEIKSCRQPQNKPREGRKAQTIAGFYGKIARDKLLKWNLDLTQTHALRHLANMNGRMIGLNPTQLAQSLGHSVQMNESVYTKRQATKTTIDLLLNSQKQPLGLTNAIAAAKTILKGNSSRQALEAVIEVLAAIYHEDLDTIADMLK